MTERVSVTVEAGVADVRLTRADKRNALDMAMFDGLLAAGKEVASNPRIRAAVLSGDGAAFCAGLDLALFAAFASPDPSAQPTAVLASREPGNPANLAQRICTIWQEVPVPVIAAVHGVAFGGGLQLALGADIRLGRPDARLSVREIAWGIVPDMSGTQMLRHLVGLDVAKELTFTGREVSGIEAHNLGLITRICDDPRSTALTLAAEMAQRSPDALRAAKKLLNASVSCSFSEGLRLEESLQRSLLGSPNQVEAVQAAVEKRPPRFRDPE